MSKDLGASLPATLLDALKSEDVTAERGRAILIATIDERGRSHPAMLSYREVGTGSASSLRVVTYEGTSTTAHLRATGDVTLMFVDERFVFYVKGRATEVPERSTGGNAAFDVAVEQVLEDAPGADEQGVYITSGVEFHNPWQSGRREGLSD